MKPSLLVKGARFLIQDSGSILEQADLLVELDGHFTAVHCVQVSAKDIDPATVGGARAAEIDAVVLRPVKASDVETTIVNGRVLMARPAQQAGPAPNQQSQIRRRDLMALEDIAVKLVGVSGSPRKGATQYCVRAALAAAEEIPGVTTEFIDLRGKKFGFCNHCNRCVKEGVRHCLGNKEDDLTPDIYEQMATVDGIILGSPVYQMTMSAQLQAFINRMRPIAPLIRQGHWASRVGGGIAVGGTRNGGQETTLLAINNFFLCTGMVSVSGGVYAYNGGSVWSQDKKEQGAEDDTVGMETVKVLGRRVAMTAKMLKVGAAQLAQGYDPLLFTGLRGQADVDKRAERFKHQ